VLNGSFLAFTGWMDTVEQLTALGSVFTCYDRCLTLEMPRGRGPN
jgi:hypothetical protein